MKIELLNNISEITNPNLDLESITVSGIKLGDSFDSIPDELKSANRFNGRWLHTNKDVTFRISENEPGTVVEFLFRPTALQKLDLSTIESIESVFGKADGIEQKRSITYYFYKQQNMVVAWMTNNKELLGVYLGENSIQVTEFRIKDFLDKFYEFKAMVPDHTQWKGTMLKYNEPRFYRLKELQSLMRAFDIGTNLLDDYQNRNFLKRRSVEDFKPILEDIEKYANTSDREKERWDQESERMNSIHGFEMLIQSFMRFSEEMRTIMRFNGGWLEAGSITSRYSIYKTQKLLNAIDFTELYEIESLLGKILDPNDRAFTKVELNEAPRGRAIGVS